MSDEKGYNGWKNYETWVAKLWMDNERGSYEYVRSLAREIQEGAPTMRLVEERIWTAEEAARFTLEDRLEDDFREAMPEVEGMWSDLLSAAFQEIDWLEIATNVLQEVGEE